MSEIEVETTPYFELESIRRRYVSDLAVKTAFEWAHIRHDDTQNYVQMIGNRVRQPFVTDYRVTFDATVWLPDEPDTIENIVVVEFSFGNMESYAVKVDLRKPLSSYIRMI